MCRNAKIPAKTNLKALIGDIYELPEGDFESEEEVNSFDHPYVPIVTNEEPDRVQLAMWGLVPEWVRDEAQAKQMADSCRNAVAETMFDKPSFRDAAKNKRCLIFLQGFYEWEHLDPKGMKKQKHYVDLKDNSVMAMGGLWTEYTDNKGTKIKTCVVITTAANPLMAKVHNSKERQPLILPQYVWPYWLRKDATKEEVMKMCEVYGDENMQAKAISEQTTELPRTGELF